MIIPLLVLFAGGAVLLAALGLSLFLIQENSILDERMQSARSDLDHTSKILIQKNIELFDENVRQQKLLESKDDFIAIVSHQLRTPITEVKWNLASTLNNPTLKLDPEQRTSVELLYSSIEHMIRLIDDIVRLVNSTQNMARQNVDPYDPDAVVQATYERVQKDFAQKPMKLHGDLHYKGTLNSIDQDSLDMTIGNLIENAFHYTPEHGTITVHTSRDAAGNFVCEVKDTGMGISEEKQKTMFVKFRRSQDAIKVNERGSGLGLYIAKNILEQHGGSISFISAEHTGSTFRVVLPPKASGGA